MAALALGIAFVTGCGEPATVETPPDQAVDHAVPLDLGTSGVTLSGNGAPRPLDAWYSIYFEAEHSTAMVELVVTFVDPAFTCAVGANAAGLDAISFVFVARAPGVSATQVFARSGPLLGTTSAGSGFVGLTTVDDRFAEVDAGTVIVSPGGEVTGLAKFQIGALSLDGNFRAPHCAALDFAAAQ